MLVLVKKACTFAIVAGVAACFAQAASALDLNTITPPPPKAQPKPDWAGFYFKNNSGAPDPWTALAPAASSGFSSPTAASAPTNETFGYNFQSGNFVFGLEGSLAAANFDGKFTAPYSPATTTGAWTPNMNWLGTVTGRLGYSVGQWLPYVKGGFAAAEVGSPLQGPGQLGSFTQGTTTGGLTAGVGFEYEFSPKWSLGLEYLYTDLGNVPSGAPGAPGSGSPEMYSTALKSQSLLGRLNYKAGW